MTGTEIDPLKENVWSQWIHRRKQIHAGGEAMGSAGDGAGPAAGPAGPAGGVA